MIGRTKLSHDQVLIDPGANEIAAEIAAAARAADAMAEHGFLRTATLPPPEGPEGHRQQMAELEPEHRDIPPEENRNVAVLGLAWWTDRISRRHVRVIGGASKVGFFRYQTLNRRFGPYRPLELFPEASPWARVHPERARRLARLRRERAQRPMRRFNAAAAAAHAARATQQIDPRTDPGTELRDTTGWHWREVFSRSRHLPDSFYIYDGWRNILALSRLVAHTRDEHASYNPGSSVHCTSRDLLFLDGGFESRHGNYMPGRRGSWIRGLRAFRFVCYELGLVQPRRLKGEERIPSHEELLHELGHIKPVLRSRHTLV